MENNTIIVYDELEKLVQERPLSVVSLVDITVSLMKIIETITSMSGLQKKSVVIQVLQQYITKHVEAPADLLFLVDVILPPTIDMIIALDKNEISIHIKQLKTGCMKKCWNL